MGDIKCEMMVVLRKFSDDDQALEDRLAVVHYVLINSEV